MAKQKFNPLLPFMFQEVGTEEGGGGNVEQYIHPTSHPASMIVETDEERFISSTEKAQIETNRATNIMLTEAFASYNYVQNAWKVLGDTEIALDPTFHYYSMIIGNGASPVTINADNFLVGLAMPAKALSFTLKVTLTKLGAAIFPANVIFYKGAGLLYYGDYYYKFIWDYQAQVWIAYLLAKNISYVVGSGVTLYVNGATGNDANNGLSWATAKKTIQAAHDAASTGDVLMITAGVYRPTYGVGTARTFNITKGINLYGGCVGTESSPSERPVLQTISQMYETVTGFDTLEVETLANPTILTGEFNDNENILTVPAVTYGCRYTTASMANNALDVVTKSGLEVVIMDGFKIQKASRYGITGNINLYLYHSEITECKNFGIKSISTTDMLLKYTGGTSESICYNFIAKNNKGNFTFFNSQLFYGIIQNCDSDNNSLIGNNYTLALAFNLEISNNSIQYYSFADGIFKKCIIKNNQSGFINSCIVAYYADSKFTNCKIYNNIGGSNSVFAVAGAQFVNCEIANNTFKTYNGGVLINCTYVCNRLLATGDYSLSGAVVKNSVIWGNRKAGLLVLTNPNNTFTFSALEGEHPLGNNISLSSDNLIGVSAPKFISPSPIDGVDNVNVLNYDLQATSALINTGKSADNNELYDLKNRKRKVATIDIGAYEYQ